MWSLSIGKHEANVIMNLNTCRSQGVGEEMFLCQPLKGGCDLTS